MIPHLDQMLMVSGVILVSMLLERERKRNRERFVQTLRTEHVILGHVIPVVAGPADRPHEYLYVSDVYM